MLPVQGLIEAVGLALYPLPGLVTSSDSILPPLTIGVTVAVVPPGAPGGEIVTVGLEPQPEVENDGWPAITVSSPPGALDKLPGPKLEPATMAVPTVLPVFCRPLPITRDKRGTVNENDWAQDVVSQIFNLPGPRWSSIGTSLPVFDHGRLFITSPAWRL